MKIKVKTDEGVASTIEVEATDYIHDVRQKIERGRRLRLYSEDRGILSDSKTLNDYGIAENQALELTAELYRNVRLDIPRLLEARMPVQEDVDGVQAFHLGLGSSASSNMALRKQLGKPGPPFGGMGFFDPQVHDVDSCGDITLPPKHLTKDVVRTIKLREFQRCAAGRPSMYNWCLQPIYNYRGEAVFAEILVRAHNGVNSAPFEDLKALANPRESPEVRQIYVEWKTAEMVDFVLRILHEHPALRTLNSILTNVRPRDLDPEGDFYKEVVRKLASLSDEDRQLLRRTLVIEVVEDQKPPEPLAPKLEAWEALGFMLAHDDTIGDLAYKSIGSKDVNYHLISALDPLVAHFDTVKVDIEWAGYAIFLSHPAYASRAAVKAEVLAHARDEDRVYVTAGSGLRDIGVSHTALLAEFATWTLRMIGLHKKICVELSVNESDESNALALGKLRTLGLDMFGLHSGSFSFQGGPTGAQAFRPDTLAGAVGTSLPATPTSSQMLGNGCGCLYAPSSDRRDFCSCHVL